MPRAGTGLRTVAAKRFASLINEYSHLIASRTDGTVRAYDRVLEDLQHRFYTSGTDSLLDGLSYWTGCQAALIVGQDTFVKPPVPVLNEAVFYPAYWRKEPQKSPLSHVSLYSSSYSEKMLLQAELFKNRLPFGVLCLIGEEGQIRAIGLHTFKLRLHSMYRYRRLQTAFPPD